MGYIASTFYDKALSLAGQGQASPERFRSELLQDIGLSAGLTRDAGDGMLDDSAFFSLLEAIAQRCDAGRSIGIRIGATMRCDDYGAFGLAFKSATHLEGSFERVQRYGKVVTNVANFTLEQGTDGSSKWMTVPSAASGRLGELMTNELALAAATALSREVSGDGFAPEAVSFAHRAPDESTEAQTFFRCPVTYSAERNGLRVSLSSLEVANRLGDAKISEFFDHHLNTELEQRTSAQPLDARVRRMVTRALSEGPPKIESIAAQLGVSQRTLQRRLAAEGHVYLDLLEQARRDLATSLLGQHTYALAEVAFLCGYADQSTFTRAFKRWKGVTPADFRKAAASDG
ncbi:MAG: AraC family transcriptional regulator ligand-binding domain-containing protein [Pseudomonadota bacterium]